MPRAKHGFTLLEVMVVVSIALMVMLMITPIFSVVSRTVQKVEEKLDVYEAARNVLDNFELEVQQAIQNERGEMFGIKNVSFKGTAGLDPFCKAGFNPDGTSRYYFDERSADAVHFLKVRTQSNHHQSDKIRYPLDFQHATTHDFWVNTIEIYSAMLSSNLLYLTPASRTNNRLKDVRNIAIDLNEGGRRYCDKYPVPNPPPPTPPPPIPIEYYYSEPPDCLSPWKGNTAPWNCTDDRQEFMNLRYGSAQNSIGVMDFDVEYWDEKKKIWREPPTDTAVFFRHIPKRS
jgi:prepilin-type N-terminal cleavage/methylation domain-containing protein